MGQVTNQTYSQASQKTDNRYTVINGRKVLKQYWSKDQNKMVYAHPDSRYGVIYRAAKPDSMKQAKKPSYKAQPKTDSFSSQTKTSKSKAAGFVTKPGSQDAYMTLKPGNQVVLDQEKGGAKIIVQNLTDRKANGYAFRSSALTEQSKKDIVIKRSPNRYGGHDYAVVDQTHKYAGKAIEQKLRAPDPNYHNPRKNNVRTYKVRSGGRQLEHLIFPYQDSKKNLGKARKAKSPENLQPKMVKDLKPGDSVRHLRPAGLKGSTANIKLDGDNYEVQNTDPRDYAYLISRKQPDGSYKTFYRSEYSKTTSNSDQNFDVDYMKVFGGADGLKLKSVIE